VPALRHLLSAGQVQTTGREPRAPSAYTGVTVGGRTGRRAGTVYARTVAVRSTVWSVTVHRWLPPDVGDHVETVLPSAVAPLLTSTMPPVPTLISVQLPSPVVDIIHWAAASGSPVAFSSTRA